MVMQLFQRNAEAKLVEALNSVTDPAGWHVVHFHLSKLMEQFRSEYQVKIAVNLINDLLQNFDGGVFVLQDHSIIVVCYGLEKALQNKLVFQLRYLYMDDPLAYTDAGQENPDFCTSYDLERDWQAFMDLSNQRMALTMRRPGMSRAERIVAQIAHPEANHAKEQRYHVHLQALDQALEGLDLAELVQRQMVCVMQPGLPLRPMFEELYVQMTRLSDKMHTDVRFFSNRWLFRYLTQRLDGHVLEFLQRERRYMEQSVSINLHVETLLSEGFQTFDQQLDPAAKVGVVLEIPVADAFADMAGFNIARREVQKLGYRVCLDGVTADSLNHIQRDKLGVDLIKLQWNATLLEPGERRQDLTRAVSANGSSRVILCRCDDRHAVEYGQSIGIALFQGRYIDSLRQPKAGVA